MLILWVNITLTVFHSPPPDFSGKSGTSRLWMWHILNMWAVARLFFFLFSILSFLLVTAPLFFPNLIILLIDVIMQMTGHLFWSVSSAVSVRLGSLVCVLRDASAHTQTVLLDSASASCWEGSWSPSLDMSLGFGATAEILIYTWYLIASILDDPMTRAGGPVRHVAFYTQYTIYGYPKNLSVIIFWKKHDIHGMKNILMILRAVFHYKEPFVQWMLRFYMEPSMPIKNIFLRVL